MKISEDVSVEVDDSILLGLVISCPCACHLDCGLTHAANNQSTTDINCIDKS